MRGYNLLCFVLFALIVGSTAWPHNTRRDSDNQHAKGTILNTATTGHVGAVDDDITFPDDDMIDNRKDFSAEGKGEDCIDNICESAKDYPSNHIEKIVSRLSEASISEVVGSYVNTTNRAKPEDPEWSYLCEVVTHTAYPKTMKNLRNETKYIVNHEKYKQGVVFEKCVTTDMCAKEAAFPVGIKAQCIQKYSQVRLLAVENDSKGDGVPDTFVIPSCCVCAFLKPKV